MTIIAVSAVSVLSLGMLGLTRLRAILTLYALQTIGLGALAVFLGVHRAEITLIIAGAAIMVLKGIGVPFYLAHIASRIDNPNYQGLFIPPPLLMVLTTVGFAILLLGRSANSIIPSDLLPGMLQLILGMLLMITRRGALSQVVGFLVLENGVFLYSIGQSVSLPLIVELGALLDLLMGTMVAGLLIINIKMHFEDIDVTALKELRG